MPIKKTLLILILLLFGVFGVWYALRYFSAPPARDHQAEYRVLEDAMGAPQSHDASAWAVYTALVTQAEAFESDAATAFRIREADFTIAIMTPEEAAAEEIDEAEYRAAVQALDAYLASDVPVRLTEVLAVPALGPPRLSKDGAPSFASVLDPAIGGTRTLAKAEAARLQRALHAGDDAAAMQCVRNLFAMRRIVEQQPMLMTLLVGQAVTWLAHDPLRQALHDGAVSPELAGELIDVLQPFNDREPDRTDRLVLGEAVSIDCSLEMLYAGEFDADSFIAMPPRFLWASRKEIAGLMDAFIEESRAYLRDGPRNATRTDPETYIYDGSYLDRIGRAPLSSPMPVISHRANSVHTVRTHRAMLLVAAGIVVYEDRHGGPPATLDDLVTEGILDALPPDPFATDGHLVYSVDPNAPMGYVLYSVGNDGADDGGAFDPDNPLPENLYRMDGGMDALWTPVPVPGAVSP